MNETLQIAAENWAPLEWAAPLTPIDSDAWAAEPLAVGDGPGAALNCGLTSLREPSWPWGQGGQPGRCHAGSGVTLPGPQGPALSSCSCRLLFYPTIHALVFRLPHN